MRSVPLRPGSVCQLLTRVCVVRMYRQGRDSAQIGQCCPAICVAWSVIPPRPPPPGVCVGSPSCQRVRERQARLAVKIPKKKSPVSGCLCRLLLVAVVSNSSIGSVIMSLAVMGGFFIKTCTYHFPSVSLGREGVIKPCLPCRLLRSSEDAVSRAFHVQYIPRSWIVRTVTTKRFTRTHTNTHPPSWVPVVELLRPRVS